MGRKKVLTNVALATSILVFPRVADAKDFAARIQLREQSAVNGVGKRTSQLLRRTKSGHKDLAISRTLNALEQGGVLSDSKVDRTEKGYLKTTYIGGNWHVSIYGDGEKIKFRKGRMSAAAKEGDEERAIRMLIDDRKTNEELEVLGRRVIERVISKVVSFSKSDVIVPSHTLHLVEGSKSKNGSSTKELVSGSTIVFSRRINDINVVGSGSKIAVMFDNSGNLEGFDVQWSSFEPLSSKIDNVSGDMQRERINALLSKHKGEVKIDSVECGYVDFGFMRRIKVSDRMQTGCQVTFLTGEQQMKPNLMFVPSANDPVVTNDFWPELNEIAEKGDVCTQRHFSF